MSTPPAGPSGASAPGAVPPVPPAYHGSPVPATTARRPVAVTLAVLLMLPVAGTWLVAGVAFFRAMLSVGGDARFLVVGIGAAVLAVCLLVVLTTALGMIVAWTGRGREGLTTPATFTFGLFVVVLVALLVQGRLGFEPTMVTPLVVGAMAGAARGLLASRPARAWFAARELHGKPVRLR